jgi:hypothetical protein
MECAVETLNSKNKKNKGKKVVEYAGELLNITASSVVINKFVDACQFYKSTDLLNLEIGCLYQDDVEEGPLSANTWYPIPSNIFMIYRDSKNCFNDDIF